MTRLDLEEQLSKLDLEGVLGVYIIDTPEGYQYDGYTLNFKEEFYQEHKEIIDDFVKKLCSYERKWIKNLYFISYPFTNDILTLLKNNESIEGVNLHNHELTTEEFEILTSNKNLKEIDSSSICEELRDCYDKRLGAVVKRKITNYKTVRDIIYDKKLNFYEELTEEQVTDICSLLEKRQIKGNLTFSGMNNGSFIKQIMDKFESIKTSEEDSTISIEIENRELFDYRPFTDKEQNARIKVITNTDEPTDMNIFIKVEEKLVEITKEYKEHEEQLSPLERLFWLYQIVETYRKYKKESDDKDWEMSRFLNKLLFSKDLVCVGFSHLLAELSQRASLQVWENCSIAHCEDKNNITKANYNHMNNLIFLEDEKYNIKGLYLLDATHDNHEYKDFFVFNHFLITPEKYDKHIMKMYEAGYSLLTVKEKESFLETLRCDEISLSSLIDILKLYYGKHELFNVCFSSSDAGNSYYLDKAELLYELTQGITIEPIPQETLKNAFIQIEKIKNPSITVEELTEKIDETFNVYKERDDKIYNWQKVKECKK